MSPRTKIGLRIWRGFFIHVNLYEHADCGTAFGIASAAFVCRTLSTSLLSISATFQVSAGSAMIAVVYMRVMLPESLVTEDECFISRNSVGSMACFADVMSLLKTTQQVVVVGFFSSLGEVGLQGSMMYYLKARFHFNKDGFADLMIIAGKVGPSAQGKAQGSISGICSLANVVSPFIFSPLTALFLSQNPPFHFPGFSIICTAFATMIALIQSLMIPAPPPISTHLV